MHTQDKPALQSKTGLLKGHLGYKTPSSQSQNTFSLDNPRVRNVHKQASWQRAANLVAADAPIYTEKKAVQKTEPSALATTGNPSL